MPQLPKSVFPRQASKHHDQPKPKPSKEPIKECLKVSGVWSLWHCRIPEGYYAEHEKYGRFWLKARDTTNALVEFREQVRRVK